jgi:serine/threonine protein kinase
VPDRGSATRLDRRLADPGPSKSLGEVGRFEIERELGHGGAGVVYLARDRELGRNVALKVLRGADPASLMRFRREAIAVARIQHEGVVRIYELGLDAEVPYLVLEYAAGGSVAELVLQRGDWLRASRLILSAARGLGAAHAVGVVHRDVKPSNLLLRSPGEDRVQIADFGIAKLEHTERLTEDGTIIGTLGFLSPEQARGEVVDARSDVFSLAVTWFRLLTGRAAFAGTALELLRKAARRAVPDPRRFNRQVPAALAEYVMRMGALEPAERPRNGADAAEVIEELLGRLDARSKRRRSH